MGGFTLVPPPTQQGDDKQKYTLVPPPSLASIPAADSTAAPLPGQEQQPFPEWFTRALSAAQSYYVDPTNRYLEAGTKVGKAAGGKVGESLFEPTPNVPYSQADEKESGQEFVKEAGVKPYEQHPAIMGASRSIGGLAAGTVIDPRNWPFFFMGGGEARPLLQKLISGGFGLNMGKGAIDQAGQLGEQWDNLTPEQRYEGVTDISLQGIMAGMAGGHAVAGEVTPKLSPQERAALIDLLKDHYKTSLAKGDVNSVEDSIHALAAVIPQEAISAPDHLSPVNKAAVTFNLIPRGEFPEGWYDFQDAVTGGSFNIRKSDIGNFEAIQAKLDQQRGQIDVGQLDPLLQESKVADAAKRFEAFKASLGIKPEVEGEGAKPATKQAEEGVSSVQGQPAGGPVPAAGAEAREAPTSPLAGEANLRPDQRAAGGEGHLAPNPEPSAGAQANGGISGGLETILPVFNEVVAEGKGLDREGSAGAAQADEPPPPVISREVDQDLANGGIHVVKRGEDMGVIARIFGSLQESARKMNAEGHPLGPLLTKLTGAFSDITKAITRNQVETLLDWKTNAKRVVNDAEWDRVVDLMDDPRITPDSRPPNIPDNVWQAYLTSRRIDEGIRTRIIEAKRKELAIMGVKPDLAQQWIPDDWGMPQGHYPHAFPGDWTITKLTGVDEKGNEVYEPIETGWRALSRNAAKEKAAEYLAANPGTQLKVDQDTYTLPGKDISDRARLHKLVDEVRNSQQLIAGGVDPEDVLKALYDESSKQAYSPLGIARRQFGHALERETNLPGWTRDMDNFEKYLLSSERYIQMAPARQMIMRARNAIAEMADLPTVQRPSDIPSSMSYSAARQYGNILARVDSAIEGLEGRPGFSDAFTRSVLNKLGWDPNLANTFYRPLQAVEAFIKLGMSPARILTHGLQTMWAVYPILGELGTIDGIANAYNPKFDWLVQDLDIPHATNANDIEGMRTYMADYFGRGNTPIDWTKGSASILRDIGMIPFTMGIDFTRRAAAVGAYIDGLERQGMTQGQARNYARDVLDRTTGQYSASDNSPFTRNLPAPVAQFKNFFLKTSQFLWGLRTPGEIGRFMIAMSVIGYAGFPLLRGVSNFVQNMTGYDAEDSLKKAFSHTSRGMFGLAGVDIPSGVGLGDLSVTRDRTPLMGLGGPAVSDAIAIGSALIERGIKGPSREASQNVDDALRNISPEARRLYDEGVRLAGKPSLTDPHSGETILSHLTPLERAQMVMGLTPLRVAQERVYHETIRNQIAKEKDERGYFVDRLAEMELGLSAPMPPEQHQKAMQDILDLSKEAQAYGVSNGLAKAVMQRAREMQVERLQRDVKKAPKVERFPAYQQQQEYHLEFPQE